MLTLLFFFLILIFCAVGACFAGLMLWQALQFRGVIHQRKISGDAAVADLLVYASVVDDGVIMGKNGSLMAAWEYTCCDFSSAPDEEKNAISTRLNQVLASLGSGWMLHVDAIRTPVENYSQRELSHFPDAISKEIEEERRRLFESKGKFFESKFVLTLTYFPPSRAEKKFAALMRNEASGGKESQYSLQVLENFKRDLENFESKISNILKLRRLKSEVEITEENKVLNFDDFLSHLQYCISGIQQPMRLPREPVCLDAILGGQELWVGTIPKIGDNFVQVVNIEGFPECSSPGILSALSELPVEHRWSTRYIFLDLHQATSMYDRLRAKWAQKRTPFLAQVFRMPTDRFDQNAERMVADADEAQAEIAAGEVAMGFYTSVVVLMAKDREKLETSSRVLAKHIAQLGFAARIESINTMDAFVGSWPGHGVENVRRPLLHTRNLADLLPLNSIWTGEDKAPCPLFPPLAPPLMYCSTSGSSPFRLNLHVRDLGHTMIFGPTGAGKSTLLAILAAQLFRYQGMRIFCFDKGLSLYTLCQAMGGTHYSIASDDSKLSFCPLQYLESRSDRAWANEWIDTILSLNGVTSSPDKRVEIANALTNMHEHGHKTLHDFATTVQDKEIRQALQAYIIGGNMGHIFDAEEDSLSFSRLTVFEIEELINLNEKFRLPILLYLFRRIERSMSGQPSAIILDEAWMALGHPVFREKIREWLKVMRKANCSVIMATQNLTDAARSGILDVITESTATKIFLPNVFARDEETSSLYGRMGLNSRQIEILAEAIPKKQYYLVSEKGKRLFDLSLGKFALAFCAVSDKESVAEVKALEKKYGQEWTSYWLARKGVHCSEISETKLNSIKKREHLLTNI